MPRTALIVGAGIGGLAAGLALQRSGWSVRIVERAASPRELGFALLLAPNAMRALRHLGLAQAIAAGGVAAAIGDMRSADGRVLRRFDARLVERVLGEPMVVVLRQVLHGALLDAVGRDALTLGQDAVGFAETDAGVVLELADGSTATGDVLIGADGAGSVIRKTLHPTDPPPRASGLFGLRGVAFNAVHLLEGATGSQYFGRGVEAGIAQASADAIYWYLSAPLAMMDGDRDPAVLTPRIAASFDRRLRALTASTRPADMRLDVLVDRAPIDAWGRGRATLLGDAAHPMLPHAGQGAAQALEDACALDIALGGGRDIGSALRAYERVRAQRTAAIVSLARRNARMGSLTNPIACWFRDQLLRVLPDRTIANMFAALNQPADMDQLR